ncbi:MAG: hypothetical protein Fur0016_08120 [Anaerolineales bacterium]
MGEQTIDRREFISRIGTFFIIIGLFALMIFISTDISRSNANLAAKQTNTVYAALARQTQEVGAQTALAQNLPTPTRIKTESLRATQEYIVYGVQALQTHEANSQTAQRLGIPTRTITEKEIENYIQSQKNFNYLAFLCIGALGIGVGLVILRMTAPPPSSAGRFEGIRKWRQRMHEANEKRLKAKKEKEAKKKK